MGGVLVFVGGAGWGGWGGGGQENVPNKFLKKVYIFFIKVSFSLKCNFKEIVTFFIKLYTFFINL